MRARVDACVPDSRSSYEPLIQQGYDNVVNGVLHDFTECGPMIKKISLAILGCESSWTFVGEVCQPGLAIPPLKTVVVTESSPNKHLSLCWHCSEPIQAQVAPHGGWEAKKRPLWVTGGAAGTDENSDVCAADPVKAVWCDK